MEQYQYKLTSTGYSSAKYGNCEVCNKHVTEVCIQSESRKYVRPDGIEEHTQHNCNSYFGHESCLIDKRR